MKESDRPFWYPGSTIRYQVVPPIFVVFFTGVVQYLVIIARGEEFTLGKAWENTTGNSASWHWVLFIILWAIASLKIPSAIVHGPETPFGYRPPYKDNGISYYVFTVATFLMAQTCFPWLSMSIYENFPQILGSFNIVALSLCTYLFIKGKNYPEHRKDTPEKCPMLYEFYRGLELHPRIYDMDVKQLTNCRIGMMCWQIFILAFHYAGVEKYGFNTGSFLSMLLQTIYIAKFFYWEAGYFYTLDMMLDRAGYYICWGCLVWIPCLYTYTSNYLVAHSPTMSPCTSWLIFVLGLVSIALNYRVDYEKQIFRKAPDECKLWGKQAEYIVAKYLDGNLKEKRSTILLSGFWGIGRHMNYTFELLAAFFWCAGGGVEFGVWPYLYFIFLTALLVHRTIRDEEKCKTKYEKFWDKYCLNVPYRIIPYVW